MSVHQKKNGTWYVAFRVAGEPHPRREYFGVGPDAHQQALIRDAEIKLQRVSGTAPEPRRGSTYLDAVAQAYIIDRKTAGASRRWLIEITGFLNNHILPALTTTPLDNLRYTDIIALVDKKWGNRTLATRQRYLGYLKALFRFGVEHGFTKNNPLSKWRKTKEPKRNLRLTLEGLERILEHAAPHLRWALEVEWEIGTRPGPTELFDLKWDDVDFERCTILVRGTKTHEANRTIPIMPEFRDRLQQVMKEQGGEYIITYKGKPVLRMNTALRGACRRAGLPYHVRMYDIRHLFATVMLANGSDLAAVSKLLGHSTIATTQAHYYHVLKGEMSRALATRPRLRQQGTQTGTTRDNSTA